MRIHFQLMLMERNLETRFFVFGTGVSGHLAFQSEIQPHKSDAILTHSKLRSLSQRTQESNTSHGAIAAKTNIPLPLKP